MGQREFFLFTPCQLQMVGKLFVIPGCTAHQCVAVIQNILLQNCEQERGYSYCLPLVGGGGVKPPQEVTKP